MQQIGNPVIFRFCEKSECAWKIYTFLICGRWFKNVVNSCFHRPKNKVTLPSSISFENCVHIQIKLKWAMKKIWRKKLKQSNARQQTTSSIVWPIFTNFVAIYKMLLSYVHFHIHNIYESRIVFIFIFLFKFFIHRINVFWVKDENVQITS